MSELLICKPQFLGSNANVNIWVKWRENIVNQIYFDWEMGKKYQNKLKNTIILILIGQKWGRKTQKNFRAPCAGIHSSVFFLGIFRNLVFFLKFGFGNPDKS